MIMISMEQLLMMTQGEKIFTYSLQDLLLNIKHTERERKMEQDQTFFKVKLYLDSIGISGEFTFVV